ncbi:hypothetical protein [Enterobacter cloacae]|uniref:hypothetical protein n=1 Tax=Enterobacter cloacae TaxID=550 RepID=UPI0039C25F4A
MKKKIIPSAGSFTPARFALLCFAIFCSLAFLLGRVAWLQIIKPDNLVKRIYGHSRFCNTDFDDKLACLNLSGV